MDRLRVVEVAQRDYLGVLALQHALLERVAAGEGPALLLVEHDPVVTVGRGRVTAGAPAPPGAVEIERGGGVTWHGPGQLVGYPIVRLADRDVRGFLRRIERGLCEALAAFGLDAGTREGATGVWVDGRRKIASIGIAVRRWTTFHGFALNVSNDPDASFDGLYPCGFPASVMTSLSRELGRTVAVAEARGPVARAIVAALERE